MEKVFAQVQSVPLDQLAPNSNISTFGILVSVVVKNAFVFAGIISFVLLIFGGFTVIVSAGDAKKTQQGRAAITGAITGLLLVLGSFWIVQIIQVVTGINILNPRI